MQVSQIYLSTTDIKLPFLLEQKVNSIKQQFPSLKHTLYNQDTLRELIQKNFDRRILKAYDKLLPFAYKTDLGRYCVVYSHGGWYFDISIRGSFGLVPEPLTELVAFRDIQRNSNTSYACIPSIFYAQKNSRILECAIEIIVNNCREEYYGITPLCPTGPTVFGRAIAQYRASQNFIFGDLLELTPQYSQKNLAYILPDGSIFAWHKNIEGGDLTKLGAQGTNNYNDFWHKSNIYDSTIIV